VLIHRQLEHGRPAAYARIIRGPARHEPRAAVRLVAVEDPVLPATQLRRNGDLRARRGAQGEEGDDPHSPRQPGEPAREIHCFSRIPQFVATLALERPSERMGVRCWSARGASGSRNVRGERHWRLRAARGAPRLLITHRDRLRDKALRRRGNRQA
jgi:hypothetical protein